jgi:deoxyribonuclease-1
MIKKNSLLLTAIYYFQGLFISPFLLSDAAVLVPPQDFSSAKKILFDLYLTEHPYTFYCGCRFNEKGIVVDCPPEAQQFIGEPIEWEHLVPASLLGRDFDCWTNPVCDLAPELKKGRQCCQKTSELFQWREAHLFNLVPVVRSLNRARSDYRPGWVFYKNRAQHLCHLWIDKKNRRIEPEAPIRGFIARTYRHMHRLYDFPLSPEDKQLLEEWDRSYPPEQWEKVRTQLLNPYYRVDNNNNEPS